MTERVWRCCNSFPCVCGYNAGNTPPWLASPESVVPKTKMIREELPIRGSLPNHLHIITPVYRNVDRVIAPDWNCVIRIDNDPEVATEVVLPPTTQCGPDVVSFALVIKESGGVETTVRICPAPGDTFEGSDIPQAIVMPRYGSLAIGHDGTERRAYIF